MPISDGNHLREINVEMNKIRLLTRKKMTHILVEWIIEDFVSFEMKPGEKIDSPTFFSKEDVGKKWSLRLYPNGHEDECEGYLLIFVTPLFQTEVTSTVNLYFIGTSKKKQLPHTFTHKFSGQGRGYPKLVKREDILNTTKGLLSEGNLKILCELQMHGRIVHQENIKDNSIKVDCFSNCFSKILSSSEFSDFTLKVGSKDFKLHKVILAARSPVFAAMFKHPLEEANNNIVNISDIAPDVMEEVIRYIYTGKVFNLEELLEGIVPVADKYDLAGLKELCEEELHSQLTINTAAHILHLADSHNFLNLKRKVIDFITENAKEVLVNPSWKYLALSSDHLVAEVNSFCARKLIS